MRIAFLLFPTILSQLQHRVLFSQELRFHCATTESNAPQDPIEATIPYRAENTKQYGPKLAGIQKPAKAAPSLKSSLPTRTPTSHSLHFPPPHNTNNFISTPPKTHLNATKLTPETTTTFSLLLSPFPIPFPFPFPFPFPLPFPASHHKSYRYSGNVAVTIAYFASSPANREDIRGPIFHTLLASMIGVLVASFTRKPVDFKKHVTVIGEPPRHTEARADARILYHLISLGHNTEDTQGTWWERVSSLFHSELSIFEIMGYNQLRPPGKLKHTQRLPNFRVFTESWALAAYSRSPSYIGGNTVAPIYSTLTGAGFGARVSIGYSDATIRLLSLATFASSLAPTSHPVPENSALLSTILPGGAWPTTEQLTQRLPLLFVPAPMMVLEQDLCQQTSWRCPTSSYGKGQRDSLEAHGPGAYADERFQVLQSLPGFGRPSDTQVQQQIDNIVQLSSVLMIPRREKIFCDWACYCTVPFMRSGCKGDPLRQDGGGTRLDAGSRGTARGGGQRISAPRFKRGTGNNNNNRFSGLKNEDEDNDEEDKIPSSSQAAIAGGGGATVLTSDEEAQELKENFMISYLALDFGHLPYAFQSAKCFILWSSRPPSNPLQPPPPPNARSWPRLLLTPLPLLPRARRLSLRRPSLSPRERGEGGFPIAGRWSMVDGDIQDSRS
ncbi:hypothetical protein MBM_05681 [Drepanopeziza brunnea f. sp. 'multigermtubi' MB_m1]|uniref:Uncharacterized protein n=1 Tax=Marssonina brunnea f. sp. multigermtubi (strain MB_m1) TaxID=1072389 RepID=K1WV96_MARBU|nr:uncharacterized protein MBM_05681 [Drepanopeziza brunnea f. sp. 'multigermtubi' MB_m1]EKD16387.1 hypothetical protein MBM_05681 [Drepanopeziza brunnea f. sp. 'multigermtubi' MB_m1]